MDFLDFALVLHVFEAAGQLDYLELLQCGLTDPGGTDLSLRVESLQPVPFLLEDLNYNCRGC